MMMMMMMMMMMTISIITLTVIIFSVNGTSLHHRMSGLKRVNRDWLCNAGNLATEQLLQTCSTYTTLLTAGEERYLGNSWHSGGPSAVRSVRGGAKSVHVTSDPGRRKRGSLLV